MEKLANNRYPIHELIRRRWSPRAFSEKPVEKEKLLSLLEAARWAPSSFNEQPWRFLVATHDDPDEYDRMLDCLKENNRVWAKRAPVLMISVAKTHFGDDPENRNRHAFHDVGLAVANLVLQALDLGLYTHQMAGIDVDKIRRVYGLPDGYEPVSGIAFGYPGDAEDLPERVREREKKPRSRRDLSELVFTGGWGRSAPWIER